MCSSHCSARVPQIRHFHLQHQVQLHLQRFLRLVAVFLFALFLKWRPFCSYFISICRKLKLTSITQIRMKFYENQSSSFLNDTDRQTDRRGLRNTSMRPFYNKQKTEFSTNAETVQRVLQLSLITQPIK
jgi:hypothetical protein